MPKVSVVVPVYNVEKYLKKCVDSILLQSERDIEIILVDDGSTDSSGKLCDTLAAGDSRVRVIHQENKGLGGARNTGIEAAQSKYILFVDSDDWLEPGIIESTLGSAQKSGADITVFSFQSVAEDGTRGEIFSDSLEKDKPLNPQEAPEIFLCAPCAWNKLYKLELFKKSGVRYPGRVWYEDIRTTLKLYLFAQSCVFISDVGYNYYQRSGSIIRSAGIERNIEILEAFDDICAYFKSRGEYERYRDEIEYLAIFHIYITASVRVIRGDRKNELVTKFRSYMQKNFPQYRQNKYLYRLGKNRQLVFSLLESKHYFLLYLLFRAKG